jgi:hypothetical protein
MCATHTRTCALACTRSSHPTLPPLPSHFSDVWQTALGEFPNRTCGSGALPVQKGLSEPRTGRPGSASVVVPAAASIERTHLYAASSRRTWVRRIWCADNAVLLPPRPSAGCWRRYHCRGAVTVPAVAGAFSTRQCVKIAADGGEMTVALKVAREHPGEGVGLMVAANSGRPGGAVGLTDRFDRS